MKSETTLEILEYLSFL